MKKQKRIPKTFRCDYCNRVYKIGDDPMNEYGNDCIGCGVPAMQNLIKNKWVNEDGSLSSAGELKLLQLRQEKHWIEVAAPRRERKRLEKEAEKQKRKGV